MCVCYKFGWLIRLYVLIDVKMHLKMQKKPPNKTLHTFIQVFFFSQKKNIRRAKTPTFICDITSLVCPETLSHLTVTNAGENHWRNCIRVVKRSCLGAIALCRGGQDASIVFYCLDVPAQEVMNNNMRATKQTCNAFTKRVPMTSMLKALRRSF